MLIIKLVNPPQHLSHALSSMYECVYMHEMKYKRGSVTDTLGQKDPWMCLLPALIQRMILNFDH